MLGIADMINIKKKTSPGFGEARNVLGLLDIYLTYGNFRNAEDKSFLKTSLRLDETRRPSHDIGVLAVIVVILTGQ